MSKVLWNKQVGEGFYLMKVAHPNKAVMGQFFMLRAWDRYPLLSRPVSVYDADAESVTFLTKVVGEGTRLLAQLRAGDEIQLGREQGTGFPLVKGRIALVGGGVGIAPLHLTARILGRNPGNQVDVYLGFSDKELLREEYEKVCHRLVTDVGGFITDHIDPAAYDYVMTCGPHIMMEVLYKKCAATSTALYVSMENRMACGYGVCLGCSCKTKDGNKRVCRDGPVFRAEEVFGL